jgi:diguanylate cyclase (GGDEF)-like protein
MNAEHARCRSSHARTEPPGDRDALRSPTAERVREALEAAATGVWDWDLTSDRLCGTDRWGPLMGGVPGHADPGTDTWLARIAPEFRDAFVEAVESVRTGASDRFEVQFRTHSPSAEASWVLCRGTPVLDERGVARRLTGTVTDITEVNSAHEHLSDAAHHDRLTGLPNRHVFTEHLERAVARAETGDEPRFAVLFGDFDRFKVINDSLGHRAGDELLVSIATRFRHRLGDDDLVARFGGDEFVMLLRDVGTLARVEHIASHLIEVFAEPHKIAGHEIVSTLSLGVVTSDADRCSASELLSDADTAMYQAKAKGRGCYQVFDERMHEAAVRRVSVESDLHAATRDAATMDRAFRLVYQPIACLATGEIAGFEALVRWDRPGSERIGPDVFIPIAEECGQIIALGEWTMRRACEQMAAWRERLGPDRELIMHANLSRRQLLHPGLVPSIRDAILRSGVRPQDFKLEITETALMDDRINPVGIMTDIRGVGIELAMDDFGTGHSSLSCLREFPIMTLKVDRAFLRNMVMHRELSAVMHAIITLAENLGLDVVAEGIEDAGQLGLLQAMGCAYGQGYFFSAAVDADEATRMLDEGGAFAHRAA